MELRMKKKKNSKPENETFRSRYWKPLLIVINIWCTSVGKYEFFYYKINLKKQSTFNWKSINDWQKKPSDWVLTSNFMSWKWKQVFKFNNKLLWFHNSENCSTYWNKGKSIEQTWIMIGWRMTLPGMHKSPITFRLSI